MSTSSTTSPTNSPSLTSLPPLPPSRSETPTLSDLAQETVELALVAASSSSSSAPTLERRVSPSAPFLEILEQPQEIAQDKPSQAAASSTTDETEAKKQKILQ